MAADTRRNKPRPSSCVDQWSSDHAHGSTRIHSKADCSRRESPTRSLGGPYHPGNIELITVHRCNEITFIQRADSTTYSIICCLGVSASTGLVKPMSLRIHYWASIRAARGISKKKEAHEGTSSLREGNSANALPKYGDSTTHISSRTCQVHPSSSPGRAPQGRRCRTATRSHTHRFPP